jgi:serine/threonine protein kinase
MPAAPTDCPNCRTPVPEGARFCMSCGLDISDPSGGATLRLSHEFDSLRDLVQEATRGVYKIERELGRGGMAAVYLATELELNRKVAIKVLPPEMTFGPGMTERFQREARTAAQLDHPNIIPIYRVGTAGRLFYFAMKYVEGRSLADVLHERGALPVPTATAVLEAVASALAYAHGRGVVHRDIKPANILIDRQGVVMVSDFGIARAATEKTITESGAAVGTPQYMSPEQCAGERVTGASDQYSLAVVGFQMLAGRVPFDADSAVALLQKHILEPPPRLGPLRADAPADLVAMVERGLKKKAAERYPSMNEFAEAVEVIRLAEHHAPTGRAQLKALAAGDTISGLRVVTPVSGPSRIKPARRPRWPALTASLGVVAVLGAIGVWKLAGPSSRPTEPPGLPESIARAESTAATAPPQPNDTAQRPVTQDTSPRTVATETAAPAAPPPEPAYLRFGNLPDGARVTVGGRAVTATPGSTAALDPNRGYVVEVMAPGYEPFTERVTLRNGETRRYAPALRPLPQPPGWLTVGSLPAGVLSIDGVAVPGTLPHRNLQVAAGARRLSIRSQDGQSWDSTVVVVPGDTLNLGMIRLRPRTP